MAVIQAQKIPKKEISAQEILTTFCLYFPAYTYAQARSMPARRVSYMIKEARKKEARFMSELVRIVAAPQSEKGKEVQTMLEYYKNIIDE